MAEDGGTSNPQAAASADAASVGRTRCDELCSRLPRLEFVILVVGLAAVAFGKLTRLGAAAKAGNVFITTLVILPNDIAVCAFVMAAIYSAYALRPGKWTARAALVFSLVVGGWSVLNMIWLRMTGVQVHIEVPMDLIANPREIGPIVTNRMVHKAGFTLFLAAFVIPPTLALFLRLWRPKPVHLNRRRLVRRGVVSAAVGLACLVFARASSPWIDAVPGRAVLSYSSHWFAVQSLFGRDGSSLPDGVERAVPIARVGERKLSDALPVIQRPHVVMLILESSAFWATSFGGQPPEQTPTLTALAREGAFFEYTRAVVARTTQSQFAMLTGCYPSLSGGFVEAVPVDQPYESLATMLARFGYRSRFSQMSRARFDCVPGLASNLGFDSFWGREDLHDSSANLGYLAGDDMRMIEPAFEWFDQQTDPCLLVFMTSISHDPYELPAWFGPTPDDTIEAFLATVRFTDGFVRAVLESLAKRAGPEDVLLCVIADHGEGLGRNGVRFRSADPYEDALRIPWIIRWPGIVRPGTVVSRPCTVMDVTPTILTLLGIDVSQAGFDGQDALSPDLPLRRLPFFGWNSSNPAGFVLGDKKSVYWPAIDKAYQFDLATDPREKNPTVLGEVDTQRLREEVMSMRRDYSIRFDSKRHRRVILYENWLTSSLGNKAWCYYLPEE